MKAYYDEIDSLETIGEFEVVDKNAVPQGEKILPVLEIFSVKSDGRLKCRIVVRGDLENIDDEETYAPTSNSEVFRSLCAIAASKFRR